MTSIPKIMIFSNGFKVATLIMYPTFPLWSSVSSSLKSGHDIPFTGRQRGSNAAFLFLEKSSVYRKEVLGEEGSS